MDPYPYEGFSCIPLTHLWPFEWSVDDDGLDDFDEPAVANSSILLAGIPFAIRQSVTL